MNGPGTMLLCTAFSLFCAGCKDTGARAAPPPQQTVSPAPAMKPAPATPLEEKKEELGGSTWDPAWDAVVEKALPPDLLSARAARAVAGYCPNFAREPEADKRAFWAYLFQALAGAEAGLDETTDVHHTDAAVNKIDTVTKRPVHQQGLLQLTYQDAERYHCDFDWQQDRHLARKDTNRSILDPENNLGCGVKIMQNQIIHQGKPLVTRTSYWSTLQPGTKSFQVFTKQMANVPAACGTGRLKPRTHPEPRQTATH